MTVLFRFTIYDALGTSPDLTVTSQRGGSNPYIVDIPSGDGQEVDLLTGAVRSGAYVVTVADVQTGTDATGTVRLITHILEDNNARQQLLSRRAKLECSRNGGSTWDVWTLGYLTGIQQSDAISYSFTISDSRRIESTHTLFTWSPLERIEFPNRGCLVGGPVRDTFGPIRASGGWEFAWREVQSEYLALAFVAAFDPPSYNRTVIPPLAKVKSAMQRFYEKQPPVANLTGSNYVQLRDRQYVNAYPSVLAVVESGASTWYGTVRGMFTPPAYSLTGMGQTYIPPFGEQNYLFVQLLPGQSTSYPSTNARVRVRLVSQEVTPESALYINEHPVDIVTKIYETVNISFNAASVASTKAAVGDDVRLALRVTEPVNMGEFLSSSIFGPFGFSVRTNAAGEREFFPTRISQTTAPSVTITDADIVGDTPPAIFDIDEGTVVTGFQLTSTSLSVFDPDPELKETPPPDGLTAQDVSLAAQNADTSTFSTREVAYKIPGMIHDGSATNGAFAFSPEVVQRFFTGIIAEGFDRFGRGAVASEVQVLASSPAAALQVGDEVNIGASYYPNKNYRIGESNVGNRIAQVVRRTETPEGPIYKLVDSGVDLQPLAPTFTIAAWSGEPRRVAAVTVTNAAGPSGLNTAGVTLAVQYQVSASTPTKTGTLFTRFRPGTIPTSAFLLPAVPPGSRVYVRMRTEKSELRASAWTAWAYVDLGAWVAPNSLTTSNVTADSVTLTIGLGTPTANTNDPVDVFAYPGASAPADWTPYRISTLSASSTTTTIRDLAASTQYTFGAAFRDEGTGAYSAFATATVTTASVNTVSAPAAPKMKLYSSFANAGQTTGVALMIGAIEGYYIVVQRAPDVSGAPGTWTDLDTLPPLTTTYVDVLPSDGITRWYRVFYRLSGFLDGTPGTARNGVPIGIPDDLLNTAQASSIAGQATLTLGGYLTGGSYDGSVSVTAAVDATTTNTASKVVARDASGNFSAGTITATLNGAAPAGSLTGTTLASNVVNSSLTSVGTLTGLTVSGASTLFNTGNAVGTLTLGTTAAVTQEQRFRLTNSVATGGVELVLNGAATLWGLYDRTASKWTIQVTRGATDAVLIPGSLAVTNALSTSSTFSASSYAAVGGAVSANAQLYVRGTMVGTGTNQYAALVQATFPVAATSGMHGVYVATIGAAGTYTTTNVIGVNVQPHTLGAGQTVTDAYGVFIGASSHAATAKYGIQIGSVTGGTNNYAIYTGTGQVRFGDDLRIISGSLSLTTIPSKTGVAIQVGTDHAQLTSATSYGMLMQPTAQGTVTNYRAIEARVVISATTALTNAYGAYIRTPTITAGGTIAINYGLHVEAQTGATTNYAIYTNAGLVRFGDAVSVVGNINLSSGSAFQINSTNVLTATALGTGVTASSLTSVGTIGTGVWQGTAIGASYGGTGTTSYGASGTGTRAIVYDIVSGAFEAVAAGTAGQFLQSAGSSGDILWATPPNFSTTTTTAGYVPGSNGVGATYFLRADGTWAIPSAGSVSANNVTAGTFSGATYTFSNSVTFSSGVRVALGETYKILNGGGTAVDVLSATTLGSGVVNSSLTSVGSLLGLTIASGNNISVTAGDVRMVSDAGYGILSADATRAIAITNAGTTINDGLTVATAGSSNTLRTNSAGYIGIGVVPTSYRLEVNGTIYTSSGGVRFPDGTTQTTAFTGSASVNANSLTGTTLASNVVNSSLTSLGTLSSLTVSGDLTVDTNTLKVDSTNNRVGVGTASPAYTLDSAGYINGTYLLRATRSADQRIDIDCGGPSYPTANGIVSFSNPANSKTLVIRATTDAANTTRTTGSLGIDFQTYASSRLFISEFGNVGVATSSPEGQVDIPWSGTPGKPTILLGATDGGSARTNATQKNFRIGAYHYTNASSPYAILMGNSDASNNEVRIGGGTGLLNAATSITMYTGATTTTPTGTARLVINSSGNVGIGTTSPSYKLQVHTADSTTLQNGLNITNGANTDYTVRIKQGETWVGPTTSTAVVFQTNNSTEAARITGAGLVGIGTTSPVERLTVANTGTSDILSVYRTQSSASNLSGIIFAQQNASGTKINYTGIYSRIVSSTAGAESGDISFYTYNAGSNAQRAAITYVGTFYVGSAIDSGAISTYVAGYNGFAAQVSNNAYFTYSGLNASGTRTFAITGAGTLTVSADVVAYGTPSDIRYKHDIHQLTNALDTVQKLRGVTFKWKEDTDSYKMTNISDDIGFIAQEVREVLPTIVRENEDGKLSLRDRAIIPLLVEAIKELKAEIDTLKHNS